MNENNTAPQTTGDSGKSGNKLWVIIIVIAVIVLGWYFLSGGFAKNAAERALEQQGIDVDYDMDGSATYSADGDTITVGGATYPDTWPSDVPKYPGAEIAFSGSSNPQTGTAGATVMFTTKDNATKVTDYYKNELGAQGWVVEGTMNMGGMTTFAATKNERTIAVSAVSENGATQVTVSVEL